MTNVENLTLGAGFNYKLTTNDATVVSGQTLTVDASALAAANTLNFNGAAETNGFFNIKGGAGNDTIAMGAALVASDQIDGRAGTDTVTLAGNYGAGLTFGATTMVNVENLTLGTGFNYNLTTNDATVASGQTLTVDGSALAAANKLTFNGAAETNGFFIIKGGAGNDTVAMGAALVASDQINGGGGTDTVTLAGNYGAGFTFGATTMTNVENLTLGAGFNYNLTTNDATVVTGQTLTVDGSALAAANTLTFNGAAETSGIFNIKGGAGNDVLTAGAGNDTVTPGAGNDTVSTGAGNDTIVMGANLTTADQIDGGTGTDTVTLAGDYSAGLIFGATTMANVENLTLGAGFNYNLTTNDATVATGQTLTVDASALAAANALTFNGSAETDGLFNIKGGAGNDTIAMGAALKAADQINGSGGTDTVTLAGDYSAGLTFSATTMTNVEKLILGAGFNYNLTTNDATVVSGATLTVDASALAAANTLTFNGAAESNGSFIIKGGAGNDTVAMGANLRAADQIDGGAGIDTVTLSGNYAAGLTFGATTMINVENLTLGAGSSYKLITNDATVTLGQTLTVDASALSAANTLTFNGAAETDGSFNIKGGAGNDVVSGGAGNDTITPGAGVDTVLAGAGNDTIVMGANLAATDQINGGVGTDTVTLAGNYSAGVTFSATTMTNVENLTLGAGFNYKLTTNDATVVSGQTLTVDASALAAANTLNFNGAAETNGFFNIKGGAGNDTIAMGAALVASDQIDGSTGTDTVTLAGNYSAGLTFGAATMINVETLSLGTGFSYKLITNDATVALGQTLTVDGSALGVANTLTFNGSAETNGFFNIKGGAGNDTVIMGAALVASDQINGGGGTDTVTLAGNYAGLTFGATTMTNVENLTLGAGFNYNLTTNDATVVSGQTLTVDGSALAAANTLTFNGSAETGSSLIIKGGAGNDVLTGGAGNDTVTPGAGNDTVSTGAGNDTVVMGANLTAADQIDGGVGTDTVTLAGNYSAGLIFGATTMVNVETLSLGAGFNYNLTTNDATVTLGQTLTVDASALAAANALTFNGAAETNGFFNIKGGAGNDTIAMGGALVATDQINGNAGIDTVTLAGTYAGLTFGATTMTNVENLTLGAGFNYNLTTNDATVTSGQTLTVDGSALAVANTLTFNGAAETNGAFNLKGGAGNDVLTTGSGNDTVTPGAGNDTVNTGSGNDTIVMGANLTAADQINGGAGTDAVTLAGDYSAGLTFGASTMINVETLSLGAGFNYNLTTNDATVGSGQALTVDGSALGAANSLTFNGSAETSSSFNIKGGAGSDVLTGGAGNDTVTPGAGNDIISTGAGSDTIVMGANLTAADQIDGGTGADTVTLAGDYSGGVTFAANTMINVENLTLGAGFSYKLITNDATVAATQTLTVDASALAAANALTFNGAAETNGSFNIKGGAGNDVVTASAGNDTITPGAGNDTVIAGAGNDTIVMGTNLTAADQINGGTGTDIVMLSGDYSAGVTFGAATMINVETLNLGTGFSYNLTTNDATVAIGQTLTVSGSGATALIFNGAAETNGIFNITSGSGNDVLTGGAGNDIITPGSGNDTVSGGAGNDMIVMAGNLTAADQIDGGTGTDTVSLSGNYSAGVTFSATTMLNVETLSLGAGSSYNLTTNDATVTSGQTLTVSGGNTSSLIFNGAAETNGNFNITSGDGNDVLTGGAGNDTITPGSGNDIVSAGAGNDTIVMAGNLTAADQIDGGTGTDTVTLAGNYSSGLTFGATTMINVETLSLGAGAGIFGSFQYNLTTNDATVGTGQTLTVDGSALASGNTLTFNGAAETDGTFNILGGAGNDVVTGGAGNDTITPGTGNDTVSAGAGNDMIVMGANLTAADQIDGGTGTDTVTLSGDYSAGVTFAATTMINVENLTLGAGFNYNLTTNDATVTSGQTLTVNASALAAANSLTFNGSAETNGVFSITGGAGNDTITLGASLTAANHIDGGAGSDMLVLTGDYSAGLTFGAATMLNIETLTLGTGFSYNLTTNDATVTTGQTLTVDGSALGSGNTLTFSGAAETNGIFNLIGGAGNDTLVGGAGADLITGGTGADTLTGGSGADHFIYTAVSDSTSSTYDTITDMNFSSDRIDITTAVTAIDTAVTSGSLSTASFDTDLASVLTSSKLGAGHAVLFTANGGTLSGQTFLVIDSNGTAGYQASQDIVIHLTGQSGTLAISDFI
jgi:Ca2+-binding RTX toxin-like protein